MQDWPDLDSNIVICIEQLELAQHLQQDDAVQTLLIMYNFLPQFCQSVQQQCTQPVAKQTVMQFDHAVVSP